MTTAYLLDVESEVEVDYICPTGVGCVFSQQLGVIIFWYALWSLVKRTTRKYTKLNFARDKVRMLAQKALLSVLYVLQ